MNWGRFERFALDGSDSEWLAILFWPQLIAALLYLVVAPIRERWLDASQKVRETQQG